MAFPLNTTPPRASSRETPRGVRHRVVRHIVTGVRSSVTAAPVIGTIGHRLFRNRGAALREHQRHSAEHLQELPL